MVRKAGRTIYLQSALIFLYTEGCDNERCVSGSMSRSVRRDRWSRQRAREATDDQLRSSDSRWPQLRAPPDKAGSRTLAARSGEPTRGYLSSAIVCLTPRCRCRTWRSNDAGFVFPVCFLSRFLFWLSSCRPLDTAHRRVF